MTADEGGNPSSTPSMPASPHRVRKIKRTALVVILALLAVALTAGVITFLKKREGKVSAALQTVLSKPSGMVDVPASPLILDARKCGINDYIPDVAAGTLTVKPGSDCARIVTLEQLDAEKAAAERAKAASAPATVPAPAAADPQIIADPVTSQNGS